MVKIKFQSAFTMIGLVVLIAIFAANVGAFGLVTVAPIEQPNVLANIKIASAFTDADTLYLQTSLQWLRDYLPDWYAYIEEAKPFIFAMDENLLTRGIISHAKCCYSHGAGAITFGEHLGQWKISDAGVVEGIQPQQIQFLSVLIHEVTHIRDLRDGRIERATDARTCIAAEQSANAQELEFVRALTTVQIKGDATTRANYRLAVDKHLEITEENVNGVVWKIFCMLTFYQ